MADTPYVEPEAETEPEVKVEEAVEPVSYAYVEIPESEETKENVAAKKQAYLDNIGKCVAKHGGLEGNIGYTDDYWGWLREFRRLTSLHNSMPDTKG